MGRSKRGFLTGVVLFLIVGLVFTLMGAWMLSENRATVKNGTKTKATVVEVAKILGAKKNGKQSVSYAPVLAYTAPGAGAMRTQYSGTGSNPNKYKVGQEVTIYVSAENPSVILIDTWMEKYGFPSIFIFAGVICLLLVPVMIVRKILYGHT